MYKFGTENNMGTAGIPGLVMKTGVPLMISLLINSLYKGAYFRWQSGGNEVIMTYGIPYLRICMIGSLGMMGQWVFDRLA